MVKLEHDFERKWAPQRKEGIDMLCIPERVSSSQFHLIKILLQFKQHSVHLFPVQAAIVLNRFCGFKT